MLFRSLYLLQKLALKGHKASKEKLQFCKTSVKYLGHRISKEELLIDLDRVKGIVAFPTPKTKKQLRGFLGLAGYCRNWIPNFSLIAQPLHNLLQQDQPEPLCCGVEHSDAMGDLKKISGQGPGPGTSKLWSTLLPLCS